MARKGADTTAVECFEFMQWRARDGSLVIIASGRRVMVILGVSPPLPRYIHSLGRPCLLSYSRRIKVLVHLVETDGSLASHVREYM